MRRTTSILAMYFCWALIFSSDAISQAIKPDTSPLRVLDSTGRFVGNTAGTQFDNSLISFEYNSIHFLLAFTRNQITQFSIPALFYTSSDCSGPAFLLDRETLFASVRLQGTTLFLADTRVPSHSEILKSTGVPGSCNQDSRTAAVFNTIVFANFTSQWSPPFSLRSSSDALK